MRNTVLFAALSMYLLVSCTGRTTVNASVSSTTVSPTASMTSIEEYARPTDLADQFSYVYGYEIARGISAEIADVDLGYVMRGVYDAMNGTSYFTQSEADEILIEYRNRLIQETSDRLRAESVENIEAAESFLSSNKLRAGVVEVNDKLQYEVLSEGRADGKMADPTSNVTVDYELTLLSGEVVDSSYARGASSSFTLTSTIQGFRDVICLMKEGEKVRAWIHPDIGYGTYGNSSIGPGELLIFDIELISVNS